MKIIVDMMGGDNAPLAVLEGAAQAVKEYRLPCKLEVLRQQNFVQAGSAAAQREQLADGIRLDLALKDVAQVVGAAHYGVHA